jgi:gentisate 1,2-dioxygenase
MTAPTRADSGQDYYAALAERNLGALWRRGAETTAAEPPVAVEPYLWRRGEYYPYLLQAAEEVAPERGSERRVVQFINPASRDGSGTTHTLITGMQLLLPGEVAPSHRHSPAAIRFIVQGDGAYTTVQGEKCVMHRHDLILTPNWTWHDHGNESGTPMIWMDGLDVPLVRGALKASFYEPYPADRQPVTRPDGASVGQFGAGVLQPAWGRAPSEASPLFIYRWERTRQALDALAAVDASPHDDVYLEYTHPHTGGHVMPTLGCYAQLLRPGVQTQAHRHTSSAVFYVIAGEGSTTIGDRRFDWSEGDVLALPPWSWHAHVNRSATAPAILFSLADRPVYEALGLYREEPAA